MGLETVEMQIKHDITLQVAYSFGLTASDYTRSDT